MDKHKPYVNFDSNSRRLKGKKIESLLNLQPSLKKKKILEIGTGSGGIANYFSTHQLMNFDVTAVDVVDQCDFKNNFKFQKVTGTKLPFEDEFFDIVISNHVIEHVGDLKNQQHHLEEINRVLRKEGSGYLATPNRWMLVEPHYNIIFLSWLPHNLRNNYLNLVKRIENYDCNPLSLGELEKMLIKSGLIFENICTSAFRETVEIENKKCLLIAIANKFPAKILDFLSFISPTLVYKVKSSK
ncbi:class I SAM-dependent methyltransferase [Desulforhopalus singaporensis]|uniref:Ubiquinone/menaquinone biosynthesis C-methylase UbiE n=1 Tax=Desulforhopalus singaporensis TaxID=91360 RepID=A0A1H0P511_9BACT|nr:class I SAM-dependent methyltransferase [Desulforhopalus singaporensis]SDO99765.1 Ubiquinone/menaquinone biosynthesis C-methylase UbiE [Desulforhopalus singaporensis]